jgi:hypothetical protein
MASFMTRAASTIAQAGGQHLAQGEFCSSLSITSSLTRPFLVDPDHLGQQVRRQDAGAGAGRPVFRFSARPMMEAISKGQTASRRRG